MRIITIVIIVIITIVITAIVTTIILRRQQQIQTQSSEPQQSGSWLTDILTKTGAMVGQKVGQKKPLPQQTQQPGMIEQLKTLLTETRERYERRSSETRGQLLEQETRLSTQHSKSAKTGKKRKKGDVRERERKRVYEERCREILERIFNTKFPKCRPAWLRNEQRDSRTGTGTMHLLELDGYNEDLAIAFEYNGKQHRVYPNTWHATKKEHEDQKKRDRLKIVRCKEEGIHLISIPDTVPYDRLYNFITEWLESKGLIEFDD